MSDLADVPVLFVVSGITALLFVYRQFSLHCTKKAVPLVPARLVIGKGKSRLIALYFATIFTWCGQDVSRANMFARSWLGRTADC